MNPLPPTFLNNFQSHPVSTSVSDIQITYIVPFMSKSDKSNHSNHKHPASEPKSWWILLLHPMRIFGISLLKIVTFFLTYPRETCTFVVFSVLVFHSFDIIHNLVALVLPFKPLVNYMWNISTVLGKPLLMTTGLCGVTSSHRIPPTICQFSKNTNYPLRLTTSVLVARDELESAFSETPNLLQLSNVLHFMEMKLGNHTKLSSQVRNLANAYSLFTDEIEKLDLSGIHVIELIAQEYFKIIYQSKYSKNQVVGSLVNLSKNEVGNLQAKVNQTLKLANNLLAEQDRTSILFHEEISFLQNERYRRSLWVFQKFGYKKVETKETLLFLHQNKADLKRSWTALEMQRRQLVLFSEKIHHMKVYLFNVVGKTTGLELIFEHFCKLSGKSDKSK